MQEQTVSMGELERTIRSGWHLVSFSAYPNDETSPKPVAYHLSVGLCARHGLMDGRTQFLRVELDPANVQADLVRIKAFVAAAQQAWMNDLTRDLDVVVADLLESNASGT